ncbi:MAG: hypothetical protein H6R18_3065, partial [Proteobacteria bacterium]|nr:hypothetical protein [Pseudomonadota bacterium]
LSSAPIVSPTNASTAEKTTWLPIGLLSIALVAVGVTIGWLRPWQKDEAVPTLTALPNSAATMPVSAIVPATVTTSSSQAETTASSITTTTGIAGIGDRPRFYKENRGLSPISQPPPPPAKAKPEPQTQPELPNITITVHAYAANPRERMAGINRRILHEGDEVAPGLKLEQITEDGVILNFRGRRFRRGL